MIQPEAFGEAFPWPMYFIAAAQAAHQAGDTRLDRTVAVKVSNEHFSERLNREARAVAALNHPNICTLYDVGPDYMYLEGRALRGPLPLQTRSRVSWMGSAKPAATTN